MQLAEVLKLKLNTDPDMDKAFENTSYQYMLACDYISRYVFEHEFQINSAALSKELYRDLRSKFLLKSQMAQSAVRTVTAGYKTVNTQLQKEPYRFQADGKWYSVQRDMRWLTKSLEFHRPQADLVRNRDYSFVHEGREISINTLGRRVICPFTVPDCMKKFLDGSWHFGTAKLVCMKNIWYLHISATKEVPDFTRDDVKQVVGIDRGLRFLETVYDSSHHTSFESGNQILLKRNSFDRVRAQLQAKGTKSAKRTLKRISGRENRWMTDVNHRLSKALVDEYGAGTLFVLEDLSGVSFSEELLSNRSAGERRALRSWAFYQFEQFLSYKAVVAGASVVKVDPAFTSQRCPKCGRVRKANRHHDCHEYVCDCCGYSSNDDRVGAMNIYFLGTLFLSGDSNPRFGARRSG